MDEPLSRNEYEKRHARLVWMVIAQFIVGALATGLFYTINQSVTHDRCVDNLHRTQEAARLLPKIVSAAEADGDKQTAAFWHDYLVKLRAAPPVQC